jgi:hypothetical protein
VSAFGGDMLATVYDGDQGVTHAAYPSARKTLCGVARELVDAVGASLLPSCGPCASTARKFRRIDRSAPAEWFTP